MINLALRGWQHRFVRAIAAHPQDDFLLVACPAAGKTIAAGAGAAEVMSRRDCDQLIVVCPSVIVRDQWARELGRIGFRMLTQFGRGPWPAYVHGVCATYAQVAQRVGQYADACQRRRTVVIGDEIHHAGHELAWGGALRSAFASAQMRLMLSGTPFRSDEDLIPFVTYDGSGWCVADFGYDYAQAVRDGVCRPIRFRAHDGVITWRDQGDEVTARFSERINRLERPRRLRAALDPTKPYLRAVLAAAHQDLLELRKTVPDAAGLIVCDSQPHALAIDRIIAELAGSLPVLAMSGVPRSHQAIAAFGADEDEWLVSVRMVSEGVDIPRLGVIVWATAAATELMVRQVSGRAVRGRAEYSTLPAIVHLPADPQLLAYAERLDSLGGISTLSRAETSGRNRDPDRQVADSHGGGREALDFRAVDAQPIATDPTVVEPSLPAGRLHAAEEPIEISTPELPPSPEDLEAARDAFDSARGELFKLLGTYAQLRRLIEPAYQLASAHRELGTAVGAVGPDASPEHVDVGLAWVRDHLGALAAAHPDQVKELARTRRRLELAA